MRRLIVWMWSIQVLMFVVTGLAWTFAPTPSFHALLPGLTGPQPIAVAGVRLLGPFAVAMGLFTALGQLTEEGLVRKHFSALFALFLLPWAWIIYVNVYRGGNASAWSSHVMFFLVPGIVFLLANAIVGFFVKFPPQPTATGFYDTAPRPLFAFWVAQALVLIALAVGLVFAPHGLLGRVTDPSVVSQLDAITLAQYRTMGPYALSMGLFSLYGVGQVAHVELWTSMARIFAVLFALLALAALLVYQPGTFTPALLFIALAAGIVAVANLALVAGALPEAVEGTRRTTGWTPLDLVAGPAMAFQTLLSKRRASHLVGVGARGRFTVVPEPRFPESPFFTAGREFPARMRFANLTELDDASLDVRGAALKLSSDLDASPFDMVMNTGVFTPASDILQFAAFVMSKFVPTFGSKLIVATNLPAREGGVAGLRRAPSSYAALHYYGQIVRIWIDAHQRTHLVRYRLLPAGALADHESGIPDAADASHIWLRGRLPNDHRPVNYLRAELPKRLREGPVGFVFQAQFHASVPGESLGWYNAGVDWDESEHPWLDVGHVVLEAPLPDRETEVLRFNPAHRPACLDTPTANGVFDPRSMGDSELRVMRWLQRLRMALYRAFGLPSFDPGVSVTGETPRLRREGSS